MDDSGSNGESPRGTEAKAAVAAHGRKALARPAAGNRSQRRRHLAVLAGLGLLVVVGYGATERALLGSGWGFPLDDAWIHLTFARNLAEGHGLSYQPGQPVSGSTAPLWTAILSLVFLLPGTAAAWVKLLGGLFFMALPPATYRLARALTLRPGAALFAGALTAGTSWLAWSALSGMEIPLFTALTVFGIALHAEERGDPGRPPLALGVLGLATLARPEGFLLLCLAVGDRLLVFDRPAAPASGWGTGRGLRLRSPPWSRIACGLAPAICAAAVPVAWSLAALGDVLPTTFGAKTAASVGSLPRLHALYTMLGVFFQPQPWATLLAGAGALRLFVQLGGRRDRGLLPVLWLCALPVAYAVLSPPHRPLVGNFGRYLFPLLPVLVVLAVAGLEPVAIRLGRVLRIGPVLLPLRAALAALLLLPPASALLTGASRFAQNVANVEDGDVAIACWIRDNLPSDAVLAVQDIGALGYFTENPLLDLAGIVSPEVQEAKRRATSPEDPTGREGMIRFLAAHRPDYLIVFPTWYPEIVGDHDRFPVLVVHDVPDNITLAASRIVFHATPWTRALPSGVPQGSPRRCAPTS